ncbi:MAG: nucleoside hydrolase [Parashewanella sp.]
MRHFLIDTDTASDDAVALIMALREPSIAVEAITVVAGNCPVKMALTNALISVEQAKTYIPPVFSGMKKPLFKELYTAQFVHGEDGMGNTSLAPSTLKPEKKHAVDAIIDYAARFDGTLEIVTLGPLTNLAMAILKAPEIIKKIKHIFIMGGSGGKSGNITPLAEFNMFVDAEAAHLVFNSGLPITAIGWEIGVGEAFINENDIQKLNQLGRLGKFAVDINQTVKAFNYQRSNKVGFDLPDPTAMAVALYPEIVTDCISAHTWIEYQSPTAYGHLAIDATGLLDKPVNAKIITKINHKLFKHKLFTLLAD